MDKDQQMAERKPDNTVAMDINGTTYIIHEFLGSKNTINDIIAQRVLNDLNPPNLSDSDKILS
ncbi:MAG: hypothetical protein LBJ11_03275 [Oscillospiraceae bacterium]|jgi:hypothetical protein|nr:hypothetical protein [Oscillospiraceae bacterium]